MDMINALIELMSANAFYAAFGVVLVIAAGVTIFGTFNRTWFQDATTKKLTVLGVIVLLLWALGPPIWFFFEYHLAAEAERPAIKESRELAASIWAAVLAILVFRLSK